MNVVEQLSDTHEQDYRSAIALNDMGVSLLSQGAIRQSMETFHDAIAALKLACSPLRDEGHHQQHPPPPPSQEFHEDGALNSSVLIQDMISKAVTRMSSPQTSTLSRGITVLLAASHEEGSSLTFPPANVLLSLDPRVSWAPYAFTLTPPSSTSTTSFDVSTRDVDFDSAVMIYNFALAHVYMSKAKSMSSKKMQAGASRLFYMSFSILSKIVHWHFPEEEDNNHHHQHQQDIRSILLLSTFVTANLAHVLMLQGCHGEAQEFMQRLAQLSDAVYSMQTEQDIDDDDHGEEDDDNSWNDDSFLPAPAA